MPTIHKPQLRHEPVNWELESERVSYFLERNRKEIIQLLQGGSRLLGEIELESRLNEIGFFLFKFTLECAAVSVQSPNKIAAELKAVIRDPEAFIKDPTGYIPEVTGRVYRWYYKGSPPELQVVYRYELGLGPLDPMKVIRAGEKALQELKKKGALGRPSDELLTGFAVSLAEIFERTGQKVRTTPNGRFWQLVELLRMAVYISIKSAGSKFTVRSIVKIAYAEMAKRKI